MNEVNKERPNAHFQQILYMNIRKNFEENYFSCPGWAAAAEFLESLNNKGISCLFMEEGPDGHIRLYI